MPAERRSTIEVQLLDTIKTLKGLIQDKEGIPIDQQCLVFEGHILYGECAIFFFNFPKGDISV
jgi:hypothetical protein